MPDPDQRLAEAIAKLPIVLGYSLGDTNANGPLLTKAGFAFAAAAERYSLAYVVSYRDAIGDLPELQKAAAGIGFVNQRRQIDDVARRMPPIARQVYRERISELQTRAPPPDWNGVHMAEKHWPPLPSGTAAACDRPPQPWHCLRIWHRSMLLLIFKTFERDLGFYPVTHFVIFADGETLNARFQ